MKPIALKTIWAAAVLIALAAACLLISGSFGRIIRINGPEKSAFPPGVRTGMPAAGKNPDPAVSGEQEAAVEAAAGVTRTFFKPTHSAPAEAVRLEIKAVEQNGELVISGSLNDGSACRRLQIDLELKADDGRKIFHTLVRGASDQTGKRPLRSRRRLPSASPGSPVLWHAHVASLRCLDP